MYFSIKRPFFALLFEKMNLLVHPQSKYPTYTLKVNTLQPTYTLKVNTSKYPTYTLKSKYLHGVRSRKPFVGALLDAIYNYNIAYIGTLVHTM